MRKYELFHLILNWMLFIDPSGLDENDTFGANSGGRGKFRRNIEKRVYNLRAEEAR